MERKNTDRFCKSWSMYGGNSECVRRETVYMGGQHGDGFGSGVSECTISSTWTNLKDSMKYDCFHVLRFYRESKRGMQYHASVDTNQARNTLTLSIVLFANFDLSSKAPSTPPGKIPNANEHSKGRAPSNIATPDQVMRFMWQVKFPRLVEP